MMREIAKSMLGFSWAVSLFGVQQVSKLMSSSDEAGAASEFDAVSQAIQSHLTGATAERFKTGDDWQRRVVDAVFDAGSMPSLDPRKMAETLDPRRIVGDIDPRAMMQNGVDLVKQSVDAIRQTVQPAAPAPEAAQ